jgi:CubicO group peptidase (beta-lactamase class C family)
MLRAALLLLLLSGCATLPSGRPADGVSVGVAFDRTGERGSFARGLADPATGRRVTINDPVRIASVSKLVVAIGVMKLVETGRLDLDSDVSRQLGWSLRNPAFAQAPVTLRQLLSHTSSVRDHDDQYAIPLGGSLRAVMAEPASWDAAHGPGRGYLAYSNLNFPIIASVVERVTGERFDQWMRREVLTPMKLDSCFNWPTCSDAAIARAITLTQEGKPVRDDLGGRRPACPVFVREGEPCDLANWRPGDNGALFSPQGGLRISARDLARVGRMLLGHGTLDGVRILSPASVEAMLAPAWSFDGGNGARDGESDGICRYGLASQALASRIAGCSDDPLGDGRTWVGHPGSAYGLRSGLWIDRARGIGIAYFATGVPDDAPNGHGAFTAVEQALFRRSATLLRR